MNLEMVSDRREHPLEASVKVLSRLDIRNPVKTSPVQKQAKLLKKVLRTDAQTDTRTHRQTFPIIILDMEQLREKVIGKDQSTYDYVKLYYDLIINDKGWEMIFY